MTMPMSAMCHFAPPPEKRKYNFQYISKPVADLHFVNGSLIRPEQFRPVAGRRKRCGRPARRAKARQSLNHTPRSQAKPLHGARPPTPENLGHQQGRHQRGMNSGGIVPRHQPELVAGDPADCLAECHRPSVALPRCQAIAAGHVDAGESARGAAQAEIHVLQVRFETRSRAARRGGILRRETARRSRAATRSAVRPRMPA